MISIVTSGLLGPDLVTGGLAPGAVAAPLLVTATFKAAAIAPPAPPSPWSIDPERSQELPPSYGT